MRREKRGEEREEEIYGKGREIKRIEMEKEKKKERRETKKQMEKEKEK